MMTHVEWRDKFLAEPQLEVYERAIELVKADVTRFSCCAMYNAVKEFAKRDLGCAPWLQVTQVEGRYSNQFKEMWCAGTPPFWWCSINYLHVGWKVKALELFIAACKEEKSSSYDLVKDVEIIREYAEVFGGPDTWKLLMRNKDNAYGRNAVKLAIYARHRVKCGEVDVKTEAYKKLEALLFKKLLPMM